MTEQITFEYGLTQHFTITAIGPTGEDERSPEWDAFEQRVFQAILAHPPLLHAICEYTVLSAMDDEGTYVQWEYEEKDGFDLALLTYIDCFIEEDREWLRKQFEYIEKSHVYHEERSKRVRLAEDQLRANIDASTDWEEKSALWDKLHRVGYEDQDGDKEFMGESVLTYWGMEWFKAEHSGYHVNRYKVVEHVHEVKAEAEAPKKVRHHKKGR